MALDGPIVILSAIAFYDRLREFLDPDLHDSLIGETPLDELDSLTLFELFEVLWDLGLDPSPDLLIGVECLADVYQWYYEGTVELETGSGPAVNPGSKV